MEFYAISNARLSATELQHYIRIEHLPEWCASIDKVLSHHGDRGVIYCAWGEFAVHQEAILDGVRFTLPGCPNALQWTITAGKRQQPGAILIHCTINQPQHDPDFVASLEQFVFDWRDGLDQARQRIRKFAAGKEVPPCAPWYG